MEISFSRFAQLTALIAAGGSVAAACTLKTVESDEKTRRAAEGGSENGVGGSDTGQAGAAGLSGFGGSTAQAGTAGIAGNLAGAAGTEPSVAGAAGTANAGSAGLISAAGTLGIAGRSATGGTSGHLGGASAGGASACVASEPAEEGLAFNCSILPYYEETCPDPSGEGTVSVYGARVCDFYDTGRTESMKALGACLNALVVPASGWCSAEHEAQVESCRQQMGQMTCVSSAVQAQCAAYHSACPALSVQACAADLSALSDEDALFLDPCIEGLADVPAGCTVKFRSCTNHPDRLVSVDSTCADLNASCSGIELTACKTALDTEGTGTMSELAARVSIPQCIHFSQTLDGDTCTEGFSDCSN